MAKKLDQERQKEVKGLRESLVRMEVTVTEFKQHADEHESTVMKDWKYNNGNSSNSGVG